MVGGRIWPKNEERGTALSSSSHFGVLRVGNLGGNEIREK